jgi:hypothetical protein
VPRLRQRAGATTGPFEVTDATGQLYTGTVHPTLAEARAAGFRHPNCTCSCVPLVDGVDTSIVTQVAVPDAEAAVRYEASQQRAYERRIRRLGRAEHTALTPQARARARRERMAAQQAAAAHRQRTGLRMTQAEVRRRQHPYHAR